MGKVKTQAETTSKAPPAQSVQRQQAAPDKEIGPIQAMRGANSFSASSNGVPQAMPNVMKSPVQGHGATNRAQGMTEMQQSVGNTHLSRMLGTKVQAKLTVNAPNDPYEKEADRVAETVTQGGQGSGQKVTHISRIAGGAFKTSANRKVAKKDEKVTQQLGNREANGVLQAQSNVGDVKTDNDNVESRIKFPNGGKALPEGIKREMESGLGADLSSVRLHDSATDQADASDLNARAFTHGNHIWLGSGESSSDRKLMAHELTHVIQQSEEHSSVDQGKIPTDRKKEHVARKADKEALLMPSASVSDSQAPVGFLRNENFDTQAIQRQAKVSPHHQNYLNPQNNKNGKGLVQEPLGNGFGEAANTNVLQIESNGVAQSFAKKNEKNIDESSSIAIPDHSNYQKVEKPSKTPESVKVPSQNAEDKIDASIDNIVVPDADQGANEDSPDKINENEAGTSTPPEAKNSEEKTLGEVSSSSKDKASMLSTEIQGEEGINDVAEDNLLTLDEVESDEGVGDLTLTETSLENEMGSVLLQKPEEASSESSVASQIISEVRLFVHGVLKNIVAQSKTQVGVVRQQAQQTISSVRSTEVTQKAQLKGAIARSKAQATQNVSTVRAQVRGAARQYKNLLVTSTQNTLKNVSQNVQTNQAQTTKVALDEANQLSTQANQTTQATQKKFQQSATTAQQTRGNTTSSLASEVGEAKDKAAQEMGTEAASDVQKAEQNTNSTLSSQANQAVQTFQQQGQVAAQQIQGMLPPAQGHIRRTSQQGQQALQKAKTQVSSTLQTTGGQMQAQLSKSEKQGLNLLSRVTRQHSKKINETARYIAGQIQKKTQQTIQQALTALRHLEKQIRSTQIPREQAPGVIKKIQSQITPAQEKVLGGTQENVSHSQSGLQRGATNVAQNLSQLTKESQAQTDQNVQTFSGHLGTLKSRTTQGMSQVSAKTTTGLNQGAASTQKSLEKAVQQNKTNFAKGREHFDKALKQDGDNAAQETNQAISQKLPAQMEKGQGRIENKASQEKDKLKQAGDQKDQNARAQQTQQSTGQAVVQRSWLGEVWDWFEKNWNKIKDTFTSPGFWAGLITGLVVALAVVAIAAAIIASGGAAAGALLALGPFLLPVVGAVAGAAGGASATIASSVVEGRPIDWSEVGKNAGIGALAGFGLGFAPASLPWVIGGGAALNTGLGIYENIKDPKKDWHESILADATIGAFTAVIGLGVFKGFAGVAKGTRFDPTRIPSRESKTDTPEPTKTDTPEPTKTDTPEPTKTDTPEPTKTDAPEPTKTDTPEPTKTDTPEPTKTDTPEPTKADAPEPTKADAPESTKTDTPEPTKTDTPESTKTDAPESTKTDTPEPTKTDTPEPTKTDTPEPTRINMLKAKIDRLNKVMQEARDAVESAKSAFRSKEVSELNELRKDSATKKDLARREAEVDALQRELRPLKEKVDRLTKEANDPEVAKDPDLAKLASEEADGLHKQLESIKAKSERTKQLLQEEIDQHKAHKLRQEELKRAAEAKADEAKDSANSICDETDGTNRPAANIGDGSTEAVLRAEIETGKPIKSPAGHHIKVSESLRGLRKAVTDMNDAKPLIDDPGRLKGIDEAIVRANDRITKLQTALNEWNQRATTHDTVWNKDGKSKVTPNFP